MTRTSSIALTGLNAAQVALQGSAHNIANLGTPGFHRQRVERVSLPDGGVTTRVSRSPEAGDALATDVIGQLQAKHSFLANLAVFKTEGRMLGALLDTTG